MSLLERLKKAKSEERDGRKKNANDEETIKVAPAPKKDPHSKLKTNIHRQLIEKVENIKGEPEQEKISVLVKDLLEQQDTVLPKGDKEKIQEEVVAEAIGYGPIHPLLSDEDITEIMVNGPDQVYVEKDGKIEKTDIVFRDDSHVHHVIEKIVAPLGRRIDESMPMVDARLPDGSRVNAIIPPLSLIGPTITIRKFSRDPFTVDDLLNLGTLNLEMAVFLEAAVQSDLNIIVSGGTGSGKTTTLNVLSSFIPSDERIVTIEDAAELQMRQEHVIKLESRPPNMEGKGAISIRDLVRNSLRMRPERIVVGEVRSEEALDMLQAMNTGHDGSLTTGHANSPRDMLSRLETMVLMAGMDLPVKAIREQISSAIDLLIHESRMRDGTRKITHITEVQDMEGEVILLQDIFRFKHGGIDENGSVQGQFESTGIRPKFMPKLEKSGIELPAEVFPSNYL